MRVEHDDKIKVKAVNAIPEVLIETVIDGREGIMFLTALQARRLARKINRAARVVEIRERANG